MGLLMKTILHSLVYIFLFFLHTNIASAAPDEKVYKVTVVPQFTSTQTYLDWTPLLAQLEKKTGLRFELKVYNDFPRFEADFANGIPDLVFLNPYHMIVARKKQNYRPLIRDSATLSGIVVTRQDNPINSPADLNGKTLAFPAPNAMGASLYIRALLAEKFHVKINPVYANGHQNVYRQILLGDVSAGGGIKKTLDKESDSAKSQLKIIFSTPEIASHPLAAHPRVTSAVSKNIVAALLEMANSPDTAKLLAAVQLPHPVEANFKRDYAYLLKLKLERYAVFETQ